MNGNDIMSALGVRPGPQVGRVLRGLLERVLEDTTLNQRDTLLGIARELAAAEAKP